MFWSPGGTTEGLIPWYQNPPGNGRATRAVDKRYEHQAPQPGGACPAAEARFTRPGMPGHGPCVWRDHIHSIRRPACKRGVSRALISSPVTLVGP